MKKQIAFCDRDTLNLDPADAKITATTGTKDSRMDQLKFFKDCLPQILLGPFLNTLSQLEETLQSFAELAACFFPLTDNCHRK